MLAEGDGTAQDVAKAWFWFTLAEAQNPSIAAYYFSKYDAALNSNLKQAARLRARLWVPKS